MTLSKLSVIILATLTIYSCTGGAKKSDDGTAESQEDVMNDSVTVQKRYHSNGNIWMINPAINLNFGVKDAKPKWVLHGTKKEFYENRKGVLATTTEYVKGKKQGPSIKYYTSGKPYIEWNYVDGRKEGLVKKFYENGAVMSEVPYKFDMLGTGSQEFNTDGEELTMPELVVWTKDERREKGTFTIFAKVQKKTNVSTTVLNAEFFTGLLIDSKYSHPNLQKETKVENKVVTLKYYESTGFPPYVNVVAKVSTPKGTPVLLSKMVNIN